MSSVLLLTAVMMSQVTVADLVQAQDPPEKIIPVTGARFQDDLPTGTTNKPMYTDHRFSPTVRNYLQVDSGEVEYEMWADTRISKRNRDGKVVRLSQELEFGLGGRFQLDLYDNSVFVGDGQASTLATRSWAAELRYALADWGVIPGNPTLYLEYILWNNGVDGHGDEATSSIEPKLLLSGEIAADWHWASNFFFEKTLNGSVVEVGGSGTAFHTVIDGRLSAGMTVLGVYESDELAGGIHERSREVYVGPVIQLRVAPHPAEVMSNGAKITTTKTRGHIDLEPLFGVTGDSKRARVLLVFGWDF